MNPDDKQSEVGDIDDSGIAQATAKAMTAILPEAMAADVLASGGQEWGIVFDALQGFSEEALTDDPGNTRQIEKMLLHQAVVLQNLFGSYTKSAYRARAMPQQFQAYADVALKAQNQCRRTLATLATIRQPKRVAFVKQLNQAVNQQVNNTSTEAKVGEIPNRETTELLEVIPSERLDTRTQGPAICVDPQLEAVGAIHRPKDSRG